METNYPRIRKIVERELSSSHHDMEHVLRVFNLSLHLAEHQPDVDLDVLRTAALLHDIARVKEFQDETGKVDHALLGARIAQGILRQFGYPEEKIDKIKHCIAVHRYRQSKEAKTKEAEILSDADKLDALGAIGVARVFMMAGHFGQRIYADTPIEEYLKSNVVNGKPEGHLKNVKEHTPNIEFELKLKHIPERLYTQKAKDMARERLRFMDEFFKRLRNEISGVL
jgi:uncharacterized protein